MNDKIMYFCNMLKNRFFILSVMLVLAAFVSCSSHNKILKSTDNEYKYNAAMTYFEQKDYNRALQLFDILQSAYRGKPEAEEVQFVVEVALSDGRVLSCESPVITLLPEAL